jgi:signal peptidase I
MTSLSQADVPDFLVSPKNYVNKFAMTSIAILRGRNCLLTTNTKFLSPHAYAVGCITIIVGIIKLYWPEDPIKNFEVADCLFHFSAIFSLIPLPLVSIVVLYQLLVNLPMYALAKALRYKPRLSRVYRASIYQNMIGILIVVLSVVFKYVVYSFSPNNTNIHESFYYIILIAVIVVGAYIMFIYVKWLGISYGMSGYRFLTYYILIILLPLSLLVNLLVAPDRLIPFRIFSVSGGGMWPALPIGADVIVNEMVGNSHLKVGDILLFKHPADNSVTEVKRLIGVPGDKIQFQHSRVIVNGTRWNGKALPTSKQLTISAKP